MSADSAPPANDFDRKARQLIEEGFCVLEGMLDTDTLRHTRDIAMKAVRELSEEQLKATRSPGTLVNSNHHPGLVECIGNPRALAALEAMGVGGSRFWKAVIISKPGPSPRLYWHQDCMWWDDPRAYSDYSPMIFLMYYLDDTSRENGCRRLLPGTHRGWHQLHGMGEAHTKDINRMDDEHDPRFADYPGEVDVPIEAGDLVVGDARLFHATHANTTGEYRTVITIWFHPLFRKPAGTDAELDPPRVPPPARAVAAGGARQDPARYPGLSGNGRAAGFQSPARQGQDGSARFNMRAGLECGVICRMSRGAR